MGKSIFALFLFLSSGFACKNVSKNDSKVTSDTTKMIEIAVRTALNRRYMPSSQDLFYQYHYKDSILFCSDSLASSFLPLSVDSFKFKILSEREIMAMLKKDSAIKMLPNYLVLSCFEKSDSSYSICLSSISSRRYGGGGGINMDIYKQRDSFMVKNISCASIN